MGKICEHQYKPEAQASGRTFRCRMPYRKARMQPTTRLRFGLVLWLVLSKAQFNDREPFVNCNLASADSRLTSAVTQADDFSVSQTTT